MVSDQEIASCVESLLRQPGTASSGGASASDVVRQVEAKLGVDLSHKTAFIQDQLDLLRGPPKDQQPPPLHPGHLPSPQLFLHPFYQFPPGAYPVAFHFSPPMPGAAAVAANHPHLQQQQHQLLQQLPPGATAVVQHMGAGSPRASVPPRIKRRRGPGGLTRLCGVSPELQVIVGEPAMPRTQIVKQLWAYIRKNNLQDPNNKRKIICNDELRLVLETDCTDIFKMNKLLAKHITPLEPSKDDGSESKKLKAEDVTEIEPDVGPYPMAISDALTEFLGTGERELLQSEALRRIWDYIKGNQLELIGLYKFNDLIMIKQISRFINIFVFEELDEEENKYIFPVSLVLVICLFTWDLGVQIAIVIVIAGCGFMDAFNGSSKHDDHIVRL